MYFCWYGARDPELFLLLIGFDIEARRIILEQALYALNHVEPAVGAGVGNVVLQQNRKPVDGPDHRAVEVAAKIPFLPLRIALGDVRLR